MKNFTKIQWLNGRAAPVPLSWIHAGLTGREWDVGVYLLSITSAQTNGKTGDVAGHCRVCQLTIAEKLGRNDRAIGRDIRSLEAKGCIRKVYQGNSKSGKSNIYRVIDEPRNNEMVVPCDSRNNEMVVPCGSRNNEMVVPCDSRNNEMVPTTQRNGSHETTKSFPRHNEMVPTKQRNRSHETTKWLSPLSLPLSLSLSRTLSL